MEDLNQKQLVLLVILVSFVTSITTGIMTVSLIDYAPLEVTKNVERIIERTVEYVSPKEIEVGKEIIEVREIVEQRIIDRGDDIITEIGEELRFVSVLVFGEDNQFRGRGMLYSENSLILPFVSEEGSEYFIKVFGGVEPIKVKSDFSSSLGFSVAKTTDENVFSSVLLSEVTPRSGATVIHIGGGERDELHVGRVSWLESVSDVGVIKLGTSGIPSSTSGAVLVNLSGEVWALQLSDGASEYIPISLIKFVLDGGEIDWLEPVVESEEEDEKDKEDEDSKETAEEEGVSVN